jgi:small subunit ribosomal protein S9
MSESERPDDEPRDDAPAEEPLPDAQSAPEADAVPGDAVDVEAAAGAESEPEASDASSVGDASAPVPPAGPAAEPPIPEPEPERPERAEVERRRGLPEDESAGTEAIPGAHLEPDLVLEEEPQTDEPDYSRYADVDPEASLEAGAVAAGDADAAVAPTDREAPAPAPRSALDLAADARYRATGKRKTSVARVILRPGNGSFTVNGRPIEQFFPRATLQLAARQPLQTVSFEDRMDVVARLHGGGVSSQAGALRHGIARALVEADPSLRGELKRRGFLTRDARAKERRKAGLKKARKRPQFSKR